MALLDEINEKKRVLDKARPLPVDVVADLADWFERELTVACITVEGAGLTREEVLQVLERGAPMLRHRPPEAQQLALNHIQALALMARLSYRGGGVSERTIAALHGVLYQGIDDAAGQYREGELEDGGNAPDPAKVRVSMSALNGWLRRTEPGVESALEAHHRLMIVRPFERGNAAVALLLANMMLNRAGYPPIVVHGEDRQVYADTVERAVAVGDKLPYREQMLRLLNRSLDVCLTATARAAGAENAS